MSVQLIFSRLDHAGRLDRHVADRAVFPFSLRFADLTDDSKARLVGRLAEGRVLPVQMPCFPRQMKNCEPAEFGSLVRAMESTPASCGVVLNSALIV